MNRFYNNLNLKFTYLDFEGGRVLVDVDHILQRDHSPQNLRELVANAGDDVPQIKEESGKGVLESPRWSDILHIEQLGELGNALLSQPCTLSVFHHWINLIEVLIPNLHGHW